MADYLLRSDQGGLRLVGLVIFDELWDNVLEQSMTRFLDLQGN